MGSFGSRLGAGFLLLRGDKAHADLASVDANELAAAKRETGRGQHQEEFLRAKDLKRSLDLQLRAAGRYIEHEAAPAPCAIDPHQIHRVAVFKTDAFRFAFAVAH